MKKNYIDDQGNYINIESLTLAEIYYKGVEAGRKAAEQVANISDTAYWRNPEKYKSPYFDLVVCAKCCRAELRKDAREMAYCPGCGRKIVDKDQEEADAEAKREMYKLDDNEDTLKWKGTH